MLEMQNTLFDQLKSQLNSSTTEKCKLQNYLCRLIFFKSAFIKMFKLFLERKKVTGAFKIHHFIEIKFKNILYTDMIYELLTFGKVLKIEYG